MCGQFKSVLLEAALGVCGNVSVACGGMNIKKVSWGEKINLEEAESARR